MNPPVSWETSTRSNGETTETIQVVAVADTTLTATFAPNPVITLAVSDTAMGSVYFTGYEGNTVTRAGIIKAQSIDLPYQWYEAGEIMSIEGGNGMEYSGVWGCRMLFTDSTAEVMPAYRTSAETIKALRYSMRP